MNIQDIPQNLNTYLGQKGYTILKKELPVNIQHQIRTDLTIKPFKFGNVLTSTFPAYRESNNKIYVPRYYGQKYFGIPKEIKLNSGDDITLEFNGTLRENQIPVVDTYLNYVKNNECGCGLLNLPCGFGKTSLSLYILSKIKKKSLILVHKEFLLNQWIERIEQFLPNAKIGKIQGPIIDIDNKDIVIGMIQSLSMKDYPSSIFDSFGLTIIDECHHISSEVFSCTLFKLVTKNMLGLSATMQRKDGTTNVIKMLLGDVLYKNVDKIEHALTVKAIEYKTIDEDFNEVVYDYKGNPLYSTMISKLCSYHNRSEFIIKIICDLISENAEKQIMVLGHNKNLLKYLYDSITSNNIATVGYYIGGMKESQLKISESKQIIIATYSMASEALDIKTLSTLIMVTPKTDIEQSIGRILRNPNKEQKPLVIDIIDQHDIFKNQWNKRKIFYVKHNYKIIHTNNYNGFDSNNWTTINLPNSNIKKTKEKLKNMKLKDEKAKTGDILCGKLLINLK
jgi:superfamily II DNA or RNA helicase